MSTRAQYVLHCPNSPKVHPLKPPQYPTRQFTLNEDNKLIIFSLDARGISAASAECLPINNQVSFSAGFQAHSCGGWKKQTQVHDSKCNYILTRRGDGCLSRRYKNVLLPMKDRKDVKLWNCAPDAGTSLSWRHSQTALSTFIRASLLHSF